MGHLFAGVLQHLLADQFRQQQLLGLVAHRIGRIQVRPLRQRGREGLHQAVGAIAGEGAHRVQGPVGYQFAVAGFQLCSLGGIDQVVLVQGHMHRRSGMGEELHDEPVTPSGGLAAIHEQ